MYSVWTLSRYCKVSQCLNRFRSIWLGNALLRIYIDDRTPDTIVRTTHIIIHADVCGGKNNPSSCLRRFAAYMNSYTYFLKPLHFWPVSLRTECSEERINYVHLCCPQCFIFQSIIFPVEIVHRLQVSSSLPDSSTNHTRLKCCTWIVPMCLQWTRNTECLNTVYVQLPLWNVYYYIYYGRRVHTVTAHLVPDHFGRFHRSSNLVLIII